ncbi:MAG: CDP-6-deoxy-D-xylo-4-hexulose-3-dehydrase [Parvicella sp.]
MKYKNIDRNTEDILRPAIEKNLSADIDIIPGVDYIPAARKTMTKEDILFGIDSMMDAWLTAGRYNKIFEKDLAKYFGARYSLSVNSGSSANLIAFYSLTSSLLGERRIKPGDEVITVAAGRL